ncbi:MAG TPA: Rieske (2Fe-2S) protein, partial [Stellaceae bacterium]|nr:Rieske (2Fe-2S) protein [Stellaceae bacterium]
MSIAELTWTEADQAAGFSLPAPFFYDERVFRRERTAIFFKSWHLVVHVNELRETGAFATYEIFDQSVIVLAGRDGVIRGFHNVCQHRGNRLVEARRGRTPAVTCGYHAWTYTLDGSLRGAPRTDCLAGFDRAAYGLRPV